MIVETVIRFKDLKENEVREIGSTFKVTTKRFEEINSTPFGVMVKPIQNAKGIKNNE